jgi:hypothetical protein
MITSVHYFLPIFGEKMGVFLKNQCYDQMIILKTRHAISCAVNFYNSGVVTRDRRIGSRH